jgi:predicted amidohydrolase
LLATGPGIDASYRKIHLYDAFGSRESDLVAPGKELVTITVQGVTVGLATCYDLRFADQFTALGRAGAELIVVPASWGAGPGKEGAVGSAHVRSADLDTTLSQTTRQRVPILDGYRTPRS